MGSLPNPSDESPKSQSESVRRDEAEEFVGGPGVVATGPMARGATRGVVIWGLVGLGIGFVLGLILMGIGGGSWGIVMTSIVACGAAGAVFGFVSGGLRKGMEESDRVNPKG